MTNRIPVPAKFPEDLSLDQELGHWWVIHVKPNCEKMMAAYLLKRNVSYYLPLYEKRVRVGYFRRVRTTVVPLFRGYLCFALDKENHNLLYDTKKIVRIIEVDDQEAFIKELAAVARAIETGEELLTQPGLVPGRKVYIASGPLEGSEGVVIGRRKKRIALCVKMFNQSVLVKLDPFTKVETL